MRARGRLTCRHGKRPPSPAARAAIAQIERMFLLGCTAEELAQARASLAAESAPRQAQLPLKVRR